MVSLAIRGDAEEFGQLGYFAPCRLRMFSLPKNLFRTMRSMLTRNGLFRSDSHSKSICTRRSMSIPHTKRY